MRFAIATLGCKVNQYDSAVIESRLAGRGMTRSGFDEPADVYIVNTCTVTDRADAESLKLARRARRLNPRARVIMTGCLAQASPGKLADAREIDAVIGLGRLDDLERVILRGGDKRLMVSNLRRHKAPIEALPVSLPGRTRAFLKLQEGCDQFCSFCIIPTSRGVSRSVPPRRVAAALDDLHARGFREVVLAGVHLGGYGRDLDPPTDLAALLEMIAERSPIERLRLSSIDPEELSDRIISVLSQSPKFCHHLHLPLQAGTDEVLSAMRRRYDTVFYRKRLERVCEAMPEAAVGSDIIVGFPGESTSDFDRSTRYVRSLDLAYLHVFPFSVRAGTTAAKFAGRTSPAEVRSRAAVMRKLGEVKRGEFARRFVGAKLKVLLEENAGSGQLRGYSRNYLRVLISAPAELTNHEVEVEASLVQGAQLVGRILRPPRTAAEGDSA